MRGPNRTPSSVLSSVRGGSEPNRTELRQLYSTGVQAGGWHLITPLFDFKDLPRPAVHTESTLGYTALGEDHTFGNRGLFKMSDDDRGMEAKWCKLSHKQFEEQKIKVGPSIICFRESAYGFA